MVGANPWIEHVKTYAKKHDISYGHAIKAAKASYKPVVCKKRKQKGKGPNEDLDELCTQGIASKKDARTWVLKNHPDKGGNEEKFKAIHPIIQTANKTGKYCTPSVKVARRKEKDATVARGREQFLAQDNPFGAKKKGFFARLFGRGQNGGAYGGGIHGGLPYAPGMFISN